MCREGQAMHRDRQRRCGELRETKTERVLKRQSEKVKFRETVRDKDRDREKSTRKRGGRDS